MEELIQRLEEPIRGFLMHQSIDPVKLNDGFVWQEANGEVRVKVIDPQTIIIYCSEHVSIGNEQYCPTEATYVVIKERKEPIIINYDNVHDFYPTLLPLVQTLQEVLNE